MPVVGQGLGRLFQVAVRHEGHGFRSNVDDYRLAHKIGLDAVLVDSLTSLTSLAVRVGSFELRAVLTISELGRPVLLFGKKSAPLAG